MILGIISTILGIMGIIGLFIGNYTLLIIGGIADIIENLIGVFSGQQKSLTTAIFAVIIGVIYSYVKGMSLWIGALIGLCFESAIMGIIGWAGVILMSRKI